MDIDLLKEWTLKKIESNPQLFGGDNGNPAIIKEYLSELHNGTKIENIPEEDISRSVAVSRMKNKLLELHPEYDYREKHKPKHKRQDANTQKSTPSLFDDVA